MKSEKAKIFIDDALRDASCLVDADGVGMNVITKRDAIRAVELAEQETEERMRGKAIKVFCHDCPIYSVQTSNGGNCPDCSALNAFKQKLNEE